MARKRKVEIFSAGCPVCEEVVERVKQMACDSCEVTVLDMQQAGIAARARQLGVGSVPAIAVDGVLADCCAGRAPDDTALRAAGIGQPLD
jgi:glutaredoxin 3